MVRYSNRKIGIFAAASVAAIVSSSRPSFAQAPVVTNPAIFRDYRAINDVGEAPGDVFQLGGEVTGGAANVTIQGIFTSNSASGSFTTSVGPCGPTTDDPNSCYRSPGFNAARLNGTWQAKFTNGSGSTTVNLPSVGSIPLTAVGFPLSVTISTNAQGKPTISWTAPAGVVNGYRVVVFDKSLPKTAQGVADIVEINNIPPTQLSYTPTYAFAAGGNYTIELQAYQSRDGGTLPPNTAIADILSRSSSFFAFSPPNGSSPPVIQIPQVASNGVYTFQVGSVGPGTATFIDPPVAIGYNYATGPGDPNFASVTLPNVGGGNFAVTYLQNGQMTSSSVSANVQFFFPMGGVSAFAVTGINPSAALDPTNAGAFVTGLTFVSSGSFTGTMTPIESGNTLFAATLPASRSVQVGNTATAFATILNAGTTPATGCGISPAVFVPAEFTFQTTNPTTNALTGSPNITVTIPAGQSQSFVVAFNWNTAFPPTNVPLGFDCTGNAPVPTIVGVNSLLLTASATPVPDMIAVGLTPSNDGFSHTGGPTGTGLFAIAAANIGASSSLTAQVVLSNPSLPLTPTICQSDPTSGQCFATPAPTVTATVNQNQNTTWSIFLQASGPIAADPANNRVFVQYVDPGGVVRGSTSTAVTTQ